MRFNPVSVPLPQPGQNLRPFDLDLIRMLDSLSSNLSAVFDRGVNVQDNLDVQIISYVSNAVPDTEDTVAHLLKRIPAGYLVAGLDKAAVVYATSAGTVTDILLKCNLASVSVKLIVF